MKILREILDLVKSLESKVTGLDSKVDRLTVNVADLTTKVDTLSNDFENFSIVTGKNFARVYNRLDKIESYVEIGKLV